MNAWITARRVKSGSEEDFRKKWAGGGQPDGMVNAYLMQDESDPRNTLSVSLWDSADKLLQWRTSDDARKRDEGLQDVVDKEQWSRGFVSFRAADLTSGPGLKTWLAIPALVIAAGAGAFFLVRKLRGGGGEEEETGWPGETATIQPMPSQTPEYRTQQSQVRPIVSGNASAPEPHMTGAAASTGGSQGASKQSGTSKRPNLLVRDVMTSDPATVEHDADVTTAAKRMRELNIGALPVTADGKLAGMITDRDITLGLSDGKRPPNEIKVRDVMTDVPVTASPHISVDEASKLMADHQIRRLPIVEGTRLVGILALGDIAVDGAPNAAEDALEEISEPARPQR